jgi:hypothetical protein
MADKDNKEKDKDREKSAPAQAKKPLSPIAGYLPARYIGTSKMRLSRGTGPYYNLDGTRRTTLDLFTGDEMLMPERELLGQTYLHDPRGELQSYHLGSGHVVLPGHEEHEPVELSALGYEFHQPRPDFLLLVDKQEATKASQARRKAPEAIKQTIVVEPFQVEEEEQVEEKGGA